MSLVSGVRGAVGGVLKRFGELPPKNSWNVNFRDPRMARIAVSIGGNLAKTQFVPQKNLPRLRKSLSVLSSQSGLPISIVRRLSSYTGKGMEISGPCSFAHEAIETIRKSGKQIALIELNPPAKPLTVHEISQIVRALIEIKQEWHSLLLVPSKTQVKPVALIRNPSPAKFKETLREIKEGEHTTYAFFNVDLQREGLIHLLEFSLWQGYSIQLMVNPPREMPDHPLFQV